MIKLELDTLKCVTMLTDGGLKRGDAETIVCTLANIPIRNLYDKSGVDTMLSEAIQKVLDNNRHEADIRFAMAEKRIDQEIAEARSGRRWMIGTIITCTLALAGYLSALIHMTH